MKIQELAQTGPDSTRLLVCSHCGYHDTAVVWKQFHIGGQGYQWFPQCRNWEACWQRWEKAQEI